MMRVFSLARMVPVMVCAALSLTVSMAVMDRITAEGQKAVDKGRSQPMAAPLVVRVHSRVFLV